MVNYKTTEFDVKVECEKTHKSYKYTKNKMTKFDGCLILKLKYAYFSSLLKDSVSDGICCEFGIFFLKKHLFLSFVYSDENGCLNGKELKSAFISLISKYFDINYFCLDKMENEKEPEWFVMGTVNQEKRTFIENSVAYSIQLSKFKNQKLPFLFLYNIVPAITTSESNKIVINDAGYSEFYFPELLCKNFDDYFQSKKWNDLFMLLQDKKLICFKRI